MTYADAVRGINKESLTNKFMTLTDLKKLTKQGEYYKIKYLIPETRNFDLKWKLGWTGWYFIPERCETKPNDHTIAYLAYYCYINDDILTQSLTGVEFTTTDYDLIKSID